MKKLYVLLLFFIGLCMIFSCSSNDTATGPEDSNDPVFNFSQSDCLPEDQVPDTPSLAALQNNQTIGHLEVQVQNDTVIMNLIGLYWNCCPEFEVDVEIRPAEGVGSPIIVYHLVDNAADHCRCMCYFDIATYITAVAPGQYGVMYIIDHEWNGENVGQYDTLYSSVVVTNSNQSRNTQNTWSERSDCYDTPMPAKLDPIIINVSGNEAEINHYVIYNCGSEVDATINQESFKIYIYEEEIPVNPMFCICPFEVKYQIGPLEPGNYQVEIWNHESDVLLAKGSFVIP